MDYQLCNDSLSVGTRKGKCKKCHEIFEVYEYQFNQAPGCMKCDKCKTYYVYNREADVLNDIGINKLTEKDKIEQSEKLLSPCKACGGSLRYFSIFKPFPEECPKCHATDIVVEGQLTGNKNIGIKRIKLNDK